MRREVLRMERVSCQDQGGMQLEDFSLSVFAGEIMGLLPVNNHGLTALLRLLQHNTPLRHGYVYYRENQVNTWRTAKNRGNRIGVIQSESCLVEGLTVADNIFVLRRGFKTWYIRPSVLESQLFPFLESIDIRIAADAYVEALTPFERVVVDVLKSVVAGCRLIVLRDISADICEAELKKIHRLLRHYASQGISFLYIDFHFEELQQVCDKVALMSNGRIIKVLYSGEVTPETFWHYTKVYDSMVKQQLLRPAQVRWEQPPVFEARELWGERLHNLSFSLAAGECIVLQDVDNHITQELLAMLIGETAPQKGGFWLQGSRIQPESTRQVAVIQELPTKTMLFNELSYLDNLCFSLDHRLPEIWRDRAVLEGAAREYAPLLDSGVFDKRVDQLTAMQKYELVYHRIAIQKPKVVFCAQPFRRADMELRMHIWELLNMLLKGGIAVAILAVNLADSLSLADRLIRLRKDRPEEIYTRSQFATMPISAPWTNLYRESREMAK